MSDSVIPCPECLHKVDQCVDPFEWHVVVQCDATTLADPRAARCLQAKETRLFALLDELRFQARIIADAERDVDTRSVSRLDIADIESVAPVDVVVDRSLPCQGACLHLTQAAL